MPDSLNKREQNNYTQLHYHIDAYKANDYLRSFNRPCACKRFGLYLGML